MVPRICLVTTGQPASNPRLVKEADALAGAGYDVHVVAAYSADWATAADRELLATRPWSQTFVDWRLEAAPWTFWTSRIRHRAATMAAPWLATSSASDAAVARIGPELRRASRRVPADLYIAHNLGALPAAWRAARHHRARLGFDAEDYHAGQVPRTDRMRRVIERVEYRYLPACDYVTASSPGIANAYAPLCRHGAPRCVLNVFPKAGRPRAAQAAPASGPLALYWFSQLIGPERGLEDVIRAMGQLPPSSVVLHLRGDRWPDYEATLRQLAAQCGLAGTQLIVHPPAAPADMVSLAAACDIGLALEPGATENSDLALGNKVFTYLLGGLAIVTTRTSAHRWFLAQVPGAAAGYDAGDVAALQALLRRWIDHRDELTAAKRAAWSYGDRRFNWDTEQHTFLDLVRGTLAATAISSATRRRLRAASESPSGIASA
ncbi:MAG TPA: hypothetical protein VLT86_12060 [Vicinamibacterales bacterium]|nr:hypothetical protein [Vicinamibacterales bacterium]